jgi:hypothetical protein
MALDVESMKQGQLAMWSAGDFKAEGEYLLTIARAPA